jgi:hypothetical protein
MLRSPTEIRLPRSATAVGPLAKRFYTAITDIQYGRAEDPKGWIVPVV